MTNKQQKTLLDLKARQEAGEHLPCPRCGLGTMKPKLPTNALSRHADIYICDECGTTEAMLDYMNNPLPLKQWACMQLQRPPSDFKALTGMEVIGRLHEQIGYLTRLHERWLYEQDKSDFNAYRVEAFMHCPGLTELWAQPFTALYDVADGQVTLRFRLFEDGVKVAINHVPK